MTPSISAIPMRWGGLQLPPHDYEAYTYIGGGGSPDDLISTVVGYRGGSTGSIVGTLTVTYTGTNNIATITLTLPSLSL